MTVAFVRVAILNLDCASRVCKGDRSWVGGALGRHNIRSVVILFFVRLFLVFSRFGPIRLGGGHSRRRNVVFAEPPVRPETGSWPPAALGDGFACGHDLPLDFPCNVLRV